MSDINVRPLEIADLNVLVDMDHSYHTDYVWQMDIQTEEAEVSVRFREVRLPRSMRVEYPRDPEHLVDDWNTRPGLLVAEKNEETIGYISMTENLAQPVVAINDLVVLRRFRRQGVGTAMIQAGQTWAAQQGARQMILEMQSKNYPAICLANKLGFEFCGYSDRYFVNQDIALFFALRL